MIPPTATADAPLAGGGAGSVVTGAAPESGRLDAVAAMAFAELSRSRVAALIKAGALQVDGQVVTRPAHRVRAGAGLTLRVPAPTALQAVPQNLPLRIVYQDADLAVIDKAAGRVVHPGPGHPDATLVNALLYHLRDLSGIGGVQRPGIVHRLDRGTSGLMVVAKHDRAHHHLADQFRMHSAHRAYLALCYRAPVEPSGTVRSQLARHPTDRLRWASAAMGRLAVTHWRCLARAQGVSLMACQLETGRTHQVRVHLCESGWPIIGDPVYKRRGMKLPEALLEPVAALQNRPLLHAWQLALTHPTTKARMVFSAPLPADYQRCVVAAGLEQALPKGALTGGASYLEGGGALFMPE